MENNTARLITSPDLPSVDRAQVWQDYIKEGFALTPIKHGTKQAFLKNWNLEENAIKTVEDAKVLNGSAGLLLAHCDQPLMTLDIDDYRYAEQWFNDKGIELGDLFMRHDAVQIQSGRENKAKLLFKLDEPLLTHQVKDEGVMAIEFRCALKDGKSVQDVLPPSIHPDTKEPYKWHGDYRNIPTLPTELLTLWKSLLEQNKPKKVEHPVDVVKPDRIRKALDLIDPTSLSYDDWINVGMGIHSECPDIVGLILWDEWSAKDEERYKVGDCNQRWESFRHGSGVTMGTVFSMAYPDKARLSSSVVPVADILKEPIEPFLSSVTDQIKSFAQTSLLTPSNSVDYITSGETIFGEARDQGRLYRKERSVFQVVLDDRLEQVDPRGLPSIVSEMSQRSNKMIMSGKSGTHGDVVFRQSYLKKTEAEALLHSSTVEVLDEIRIISPTPFITEDGTILEKGYHSQYKVYVTGGQVDDVDFDDAITALKDLLVDLNPYAESDRSRMMASFLTPAFKPSKMIVQSPMFYFEADESQSGKGLYAETAPFIYDCTAENVKRRDRGSGSFEESIDSALIRGRQFIMLDNFKGSLDSGWLEGVITAGENSHSARESYGRNTLVDTTAANWAMTSNGVQGTKDIVNRMCVVKLQKQPNDYSFVYSSKEGYHNHIKNNQQFYLGCVLAVVKRFIDDGKPKADSGGHSFITWAQYMNHIVTEYFNYPPLMEGMKEVKETIANPRMAWLRLVANEINQGGYLGKSLSTSDLADIILNSTNGCDVLPNGNNLNRVNEDRHASTLGRVLKPVRDSADKSMVEVAGYVVRWDEQTIVEGEFHGKPKMFYTFTRGGAECPF